MAEAIKTEFNRKQQEQNQQNALAVRAQDAIVEDVKAGAKQALATQNPNQFAMAFVQKGENGETSISPYIKKAGRSVVLNEVAKKKGGLALMQPICIRSARETKEDLLAILTALSPEMKSKFIESRGGDFRSLSDPNGQARYKFVILFRNGEKWEGEGVAWPGNTRMSSLHTRLDELAQTRAFMRCVGMGTADGFINPDQVAGDEDLELAERMLMEEDEAEADEAAGRIEGADPDGSDQFRTSDSSGAGSAPAGESGQGGSAGSNSAPESNGSEDRSASVASAGQVDPGADGGNSDQGSSVAPPEVTTQDLMALAKAKGVYLVKLTGEMFGKDKLHLLTLDERQNVYLNLTDRPNKVAG